MPRETGKMVKRGSRSSGLSVLPDAIFAFMILSLKVSITPISVSVPMTLPKKANPLVEVEKW